MVVRIRNLTRSGSRDLADLAKFSEMGWRERTRFALYTSRLGWKSILHSLFNTFSFFYLFEPLVGALGPANTSADVEQGSAARSSRRRVQGGGSRVMTKPNSVWLAIVLSCLGRKVGTACLLVGLICMTALTASAQSFRVQCPPSTITHPVAANNNAEPAYNGPTQFTRPATGGQWAVPTAGTVNGAIKCQQVSGGDGYATMGDGTQTYMFSFGPLSGLADIAAGLPGTQYPDVFNTVYPGTAGQMVLLRGDPATTDGGTAGNSPGSGGTSAAPFTWNGAVGLTGDPDVLVAGSGTGATATAIITGGLVTDVTVNTGGSGYVGAPTVTFDPAPPGGITALGTSSIGPCNTVGCTGNMVTAVNITYTGFGYTSPPKVMFGTGENACATNAPAPACLTGHVDPHPIIDVGVLNGNIPAPLMAFDEDDEFFLTLTNVGMIMRPDLFEQHTVHFHGYPNA